MTDPIVIATVETYQFKLEDKKEKERLAALNKNKVIELSNTPQPNNTNSFAREGESSIINTNNNSNNNNINNSHNNNNSNNKEPMKPSIETKPLEVPLVSSLLTHKKTPSSWLNNLLDGYLTFHV